MQAVKELEHKRLIRIIRKPDLDSFALPGKSINDEDFANWIEYAESLPTVELSEAKQLWEIQKNKLQELIP